MISLVVYPTNSGTIVKSAKHSVETDDGPVDVYDFTAVPMVGRAFTHWSVEGPDGDATTDGDNPLQINAHTVDVDTGTWRLVAMFRGMDVVIVGSGHVTNDNNIFTAIPDVGYEFDHWVFSNTNITDNPITVTIVDNAVLVAVFKNSVSLIPMNSMMSLMMMIMVMKMMTGLIGRK